MSHDQRRDRPAKVDRRSFMKKAATGAAAGATVTGLSGCSPGGSGAPAVQTRQRLRWRLTSSFPRSLDTMFGAAELLTEQLREASGGMIEVRAYPANEIVPGLQVLDAVQLGTVQLGQTASYYYTGKNPALAFDTALPFGLSTRQQFAWLHYMGGLELLREVFADFNVISLPFGSTGCQMGGWFREQVETVADFNGLKMRIPGPGGDVMDQLGATVQVLAGGEIYQALERGTIDATEWIGPYDDEKLGFHRVASNYYYPGWWEPGPSLSLYINKDAWDGLSSEYQAIFRNVAGEVSMHLTARYDAVNPPALSRLVAAGVQLRPFSSEIMKAAAVAAADVASARAAEDPGYRHILESWRRARTELYRWFDTAERSFADFAFPSA